MEKLEVILNFGKILIPKMTIKLKYCPFCGSKAKFDICTDEELENWNGEWITCINNQCGISTGIFFPSMDSVKELLAEIWNRRPSTKKK